LTDIPTGIDLTDLLYSSDLFGEITNPASGLLKDIIERNLTGVNMVDKYDYN
jgi:hypothetical protein